MGSDAWRNEGIIPIIGMFNLVFGIIYTIWWFKKISSEKNKNMNTLTA